MTTRIIQIVPRLPPAICGVADYSVLLGDRLESNYSFEVSYVAANLEKSGPSIPERLFLSQRSSADLISALNELYRPASRTILILEFSGYAMARWGLCYWLIKALKRFLKSHPDVRLLTMFHELYAFGSIWTSQFWTSPIQRHLVAKLCEISESVLTSKKSYADKINIMSNHKFSKIPVLPVFSNIGEPEKILSLIDRKRRVVIFGSKGTRSRLYKNSQFELTVICNIFSVTEILDDDYPEFVESKEQAE